MAGPANTGGIVCGPVVGPTITGGIACGPVVGSGAQVCETVAPLASSRWSQYCVAALQVIVPHVNAGGVEASQDTLRQHRVILSGVELLRSMT